MTHMDITMRTCSKLIKGFILYLHRFFFFLISMILDKALKTPALAEELTQADTVTGWRRPGNRHIYRREIVRLLQTLVTESFPERKCLWRHMPASEGPGAGRKV